IGIDDYEIHHLQRREIGGSEVLGYVWTHVGLNNVRVRRQAGDQQVSFLLGIVQMPQMARMHDVEGAVTHDDFLLSRTEADSEGQLLERDDLLVVPRRVHRARNSNQVLVAPAMLSGSHTGASDQYSMSTSMRRT